MRQGCRPLTPSAFPKDTSFQSSLLGPQVRSPKIKKSISHPFQGLKSPFTSCLLQNLPPGPPKLSTQSPDSLTFKSLNMQGPLTRGAFFPLSLWI